MVGFNSIQIERAVLASKLYNTLGLTTMKNLNNVVSTNIISNFPISVADLIKYDKIYGSSMTSLKGKSTSSNPRPVIKDDIHIPSKVYKNNSNIELCIDTIYISCVEFIVSIDRQVKYISIIHITSQNEEEFSKGLDKILRKYNSEGFKITIIHAENEFKPLMYKFKENFTSQSITQTQDTSFLG